LINWPIFNLADSMLVCGAGVLMLQAIFAESQPKEEALVNSATRPGNQPEIIA
jgi:lipoprotein signal peptidase